MNHLWLALAPLTLIGCKSAKRTTPEPAAAPTSAPDAAPATQPTGPRPATWATSATVSGLSLAVLAEPPRPDAPPAGDVRRGAATASLEHIFGLPKTPTEAWAVGARPLTLGAQRYVQLTLTGTVGEDFRETTEHVALLPADGAGLRPIWRGLGRVETIEMDQCTKGTGFALALKDHTLVITRAGSADFQAGSEEENSQTPDFDALKATCTPPKTRTERVTLSR